MNPQNTDPLAQLQDIHLPPAIGIWPLAWGWWLALITFSLILATIIFLIRRQKQRNAYRQVALQELNKIQQQFSLEQRAEYLQAISMLLRRTALSGFGSQFNTSLKGIEWLQWLDQQNPTSNYYFDSEVGHALLLGPYQKHPDIDRDQLHKVVATWIQQHRNQWQQKKPKSVTRNPEAEQDV